MEDPFKNRGFKLTKETRWSRTYSDENGQGHHIVSRFRDGSASITMEELSACWDTWPEGEKLDFCNELGWMKEPLISDVLRFVMKKGDETLWQAVALEIAGHLPSNESVPFLMAACENSELGQGANFFGALARTDYPKKREVLQHRLKELVGHSDFGIRGQEYFNRVANEAVNITNDLLELGANPDDLRPVYLQLKDHPHDFVRQITRNFLSKYFEPAPTD